MSDSFLSSVNLSYSEGSQKKYYFMAGLPRSGSTLLSSILNQNPRFYSGPSTPVLSLMHTVEEHLQTNELYKSFPKHVQASQLISNIINHYYSDIKKPIVIDKNRAWPARIPYIEVYLEKKAKILCPVRDMDEILTSIIMMIRRNSYKENFEKLNFIDSNVVKHDMIINDDNRCKSFLNGIITDTLNCFEYAKNNNFLDRLYFVEYKDLVENPEQTMKKVYDFLEEEYFNHTFQNLENINRENDFEVYGFSDMHYVHSNLKKDFTNPKDILSEEILEISKDLNVWRDYK